MGTTRDYKLSLSFFLDFLS